MTSYDNTDTKVLQYDSSKETAGAAHLDEIHATRNDKMKEIAASMVGQTGNKAENEKAARSRHKSVFQETRADGSVETVTRETKIVDVHLGEITPELAAKRKRQAKRLRKHWQGFMDDGMYHEAKEILIVAKNLDPSFEYLIKHAEAAAARKKAEESGDEEAIRIAREAEAKAKAAAEKAEREKDLIKVKHEEELEAEKAKHQQELEALKQAAEEKERLRLEEERQKAKLEAEKAAKEAEKAAKEKAEREAAELKAKLEAAERQHAADMKAAKLEHERIEAKRKLEEEKARLEAEKKAAEEAAAKAKAEAAAAEERRLEQLRKKKEEDEAREKAFLAQLAEKKKKEEEEMERAHQKLLEMQAKVRAEEAKRKDEEKAHAERMRVAAKQAADAQAACCAAQQEKARMQRERALSQAKAQREKAAAEAAKERNEKFEKLLAMEAEEDRRLAAEMQEAVGFKGGNVGYRDLYHFPFVRLVASATGKLDFASKNSTNRLSADAGPADCEVPPGYRWATKNEIETLFGDYPAAPCAPHEPGASPYGAKLRSNIDPEKGRQDFRVPTPYTKYYYDQDGWNGYAYEHIDRHCFLFRDSHDLGGCLQAANNEGVVSNWDADTIISTLSMGGFGGIVCINNAVISKDYPMCDAYPPKRPPTFVDNAVDPEDIDVALPVRSSSLPAVPQP